MPSALNSLPPYQPSFKAGRLSDEQTRNEMKRLYDSTGYTIDPHSAIGVATARSAMQMGQAARQKGANSGAPMVVLATAHPAKFPQAVSEAIGQEAALPQRVRHIMQSREFITEAPADLAALQALIRSTPSAAA